LNDEQLRYLSSLDPDTFRGVMLTYGQEVWNYAYFLTGRPELADDISQDVFLSVYRSIASYQGQSTFKTWLFAITRNTAVNYRRSAFFRRVALTGWISGTGTAPSAESETLRHLLTDEIWETVMKLPLKLREVLVLDAKYEMTIREIAELLGISQGTVKSRLSRARAKVAALWKEEDAAYERS
jgi:RNA polymerase sigma-70 factor, ECF subfamily